MSSFGPVKRSPPKRKPFVSTTKRVHTFGVPPPLPPVVPHSPAPPPVIDNNEPPVDEPLRVQTAVRKPQEYSMNPANYLKLQLQTVRWLNLSTALWSMIAVDANRVVEKESLGNFVMAMMWRVHGTVTEEEFTELYLEWIGKVSSKPRPVSACANGVFMMRDILLEQGVTEENLDILIGMTIFEVNRRLLYTPLNFHLHNDEASQRPSLETCSNRWLSLSEELFFMLDTPGYGHLEFDEMFFLSACMVLAKHEWLDEAGAERRLSVSSLCAVTVQLMRNAGAVVCVYTGKEAGDDDRLSTAEVSEEELAVPPPPESYISPRHPLSDSFSRPSQPTQYDSSGHRIYRSFVPAESSGDSSYAADHTTHASPSRTPASVNTAPPPPSGSSVVTLPMFKTLLLSCGIGEGGILSLISLVKQCCNNVASLCCDKGVEGIYRACSMYGGGARGGNIGPPKLWHHCVFSVSGHPVPSAGDRGTSPKSPLLLYLLSDAATEISAVWTAAPMPEAADAGSSNTFTDPQGNVKSRHNLESDQELLLHATTLRLWEGYSHWGESITSQPSSSLARARRDSVYQLIMSLLAEYKSSLLLLSAALVDIAMDEFSTGANILGAGRNSAVGVASSALLPDDSDCDEVCREIFLESEEAHPPPYVDMSTENEPANILSEIEVTDSDKNPHFAQHVVDVSGPTSVRDIDRYDSEASCGAGDGRGKDFLNVNADRTDERENVQDQANMHSESQISSPVYIPLEKLENSDFALWLNKHQRRTNSVDDKVWDDETENAIQRAVWATVFDTKSTVSRGPQSSARSHEKENGTTRRGTSTPSYDVGSSTNTPYSEVCTSPTSSYNFSERRRARRKQKKSESFNARVRKRDEENALINQLLYCPEEDKESIIGRLRILRQMREAEEEDDQPGIHDVSTSSLARRRPHRDSRTTSGADSGILSVQRSESQKSQRVPDVNGADETPHESNTALTDIQDDVDEEQDENNVPKIIETGNADGTDREVLPPQINIADSPGMETEISEASSSMASSVRDLLERGQTAGIYAQSLRDLLRKMSRDDSNMQLKSLEKILELGNSIVEQEEEHKKSRGSPPRGGYLSLQSSRSRSPRTPSDVGSPTVISDTHDRVVHEPFSSPPYGRAQHYNRSEDISVPRSKRTYAHESPVRTPHINERPDYVSPIKTKTVRSDWKPPRAETSLLGRDSVPHVANSRRVPGMEPKGGKARYKPKPFS